jgi:hypothetical protein
MAAATAKTTAILQKNTRPVSPNPVTVPIPSVEPASLAPLTAPEYPESSTTSRSQAA